MMNDEVERKKVCVNETDLCHVVISFAILSTKLFPVKQTSSTSAVSLLIDLISKERYDAD